MSSRSVNKAILIGNLTRDPELRYTPQGTAVCSFGLATNRSWTTDANDRKEETEFHRVVAWNKLAELCAQLLFKGRKVYIEGRLSTRSWTGQDGSQRQTTEIVAEEMMVLDNRMQENDNRMTDQIQKGDYQTIQTVVPAPVINDTVVPPVVPVTPPTVSDDLSIDDIPDDLGLVEPTVEEPEDGETKKDKKEDVKAKGKTDEKSEEIKSTEVTTPVADENKVDGDIPF